MKGDKATINKENYIKYSNSLIFDMMRTILDGGTIEYRKAILKQCRAAVKTLEEWVGNKEFDEKGTEKLKSLLAELHCKEEIMVEKLGAMTYDVWPEVE